MADYHTRYKIHPQSYEAVKIPRTPATFRDLYRREAPKCLSSCSQGQVWGHDCRDPVVQDYQSEHEWDVYVLSHALNATYDEKKLLSAKVSNGPTVKTKNPMLFHIGNSNGLKQGSTSCDFRYPRGLAISFTGDIVVADTGNNRLQVFNAFGTFRAVIGRPGAGDNEFREPTDVAVMPNDDIVVADSRNCRIQVIRMRRFLFINRFPTCDPPFSVAADNYSNTVVGTRRRTIEVYRRGGKLVNRFGLHQSDEVVITGEGLAERAGPVYVGINSIMDTIVASDPVVREVKTYNYSGELLHRFIPSAACPPKANGSALAAVPAGVFVNFAGDICLCDSLNHTVNIYSERGKLVKVLASPKDGIGAVQCCAIGPEGHLILSQFSVGGYHSVKIMRYLDCSCHKNRPSSAKRPQTPVYE